MYELYGMYFLCEFFTVNRALVRSHKLQPEQNTKFVERMRQICEERL